METKHIPLTRREAEVMHELASGLYYKEIAGKIFVSTATVKKHVQNIYKKMGVKNRTEACLKYRTQLKDYYAPLPSK